MNDAIYGRREPTAFQVMAKPIGPICNLDCVYCYYLEKRRLYPQARSFRMTDRVLEAFISQYIETQDTPVINFLWQGGEPTLVGLDFFRRAVALQSRYCPPGKQVTNALQTNGVLLDDAWCEFLRKNDFLVGLSIDGPQELHDCNRVDRRGRPTFDRVLRGLKLLRKHGVEFNTLTVVSRDNARHPRDVYRFLKEQGSRFMQFIPLVERTCDGKTLAAPPGPEGDGTGAVTPWSVEPTAYGEFLSTVFDEWVRNDVGRIYVQLFDVQLGLWAGLPSELCIFGKTCGQGLAMEHNGDLYACDHYVYPAYRLGNILEQPMATLAHSRRQVGFGRDKRRRLPRYCRDCVFLFACNGGCPKHRFAPTPDGEPELNYLCGDYKRFFAHIDPYMRTMAGVLRRGQAPATIMPFLRQRSSDRGPANIGRNDACPCGSSKKFKRCCGRSASNL